MKINQEKVIASLDSVFLKKQPEPKNEDENPIKEAAEESGLWTTFKRKRPSSTREASYKESLLKKTYE
jgi:hypothetical protein